MAIQQLPATPTISTEGGNVMVDNVMALLPLVLVFAVLIVIIIFVVKWFSKVKEQKKDIYTQDYKETINTCKTLRSSKWLRPIPGVPGWLAKRGVDVWLQSPLIIDSKQEIEQEVSDERILFPSGETFKLGKYAGHCYSTDGCFTLMVKASNNKVLGLFPKLIIIKLRRAQTKRIINPDDRKTIKSIKAQADNFITGNDAIFINALGIEKNNKYYYAVNITADGKIVDTKPYAYYDNIDIAVQKQLQDLGKNMASLSEEFARGVPLVQILKKTDSSLDQA